MSEPLREIPVDPRMPLQESGSLLPPEPVQPEPQPILHLIPEPVFPPWSLWDVGAVLGSILVAVFLCSVVALAVVHRMPGYRNVSMMVLAGTPLVIIASQVVAYPVVLAFVMLLVRSRTGEPFFAAIRWNWPRRWGLAFFSSGIVLAFSVEALASLMPIPKSLPIDKFFNSPATAYLMAAFGMTLAPLLEEIFFRGLLYPVLRRILGLISAIIVTAAAFAAIHGAQLGYAWAPILSIFIVGVVLTVIRERSNSVGASFLTHCGYNFTLFAMLWIASDHFHHLEKITT